MNDQASTPVVLGEITTAERHSGAFISPNSISSSLDVTNVGGNNLFSSNEEGNQVAETENSSSLKNLKFDDFKRPDRSWGTLSSMFRSFAFRKADFSEDWELTQKDHLRKDIVELVYKSVKKEDADKKLNSFNVVSKNYSGGNKYKHFKARHYDVIYSIVDVLTLISKPKASDNDHESQDQNSWKYYNFKKPSNIIYAIDLFKKFAKKNINVDEIAVTEKLFTLDDNGNPEFSNEFKEFLKTKKIIESGLENLNQFEKDKLSDLKNLFENFSEKSFEIGLYSSFKSKIIQSHNQKRFTIYEGMKLWEIPDAAIKRFEAQCKIPKSGKGANKINKYLGEIKDIDQSQIKKSENNFNKKSKKLNKIKLPTQAKSPTSTQDNQENIPIEKSFYEKSFNDFYKFINDLKKDFFKKSLNPESRARGIDQEIQVAEKNINLKKMVIKSLVLSNQTDEPDRAIYEIKLNTPDGDREFLFKINEGKYVSNNQPDRQEENYEQGSQRSRTSSASHKSSDQSRSSEESERSNSELSVNSEGQKVIGGNEGDSEIEQEVIRQSQEDIYNSTPKPAATSSRSSESPEISAVGQDDVEETEGGIQSKIKHQSSDQPENGEGGGQLEERSQPGGEEAKKDQNDKTEQHRIQHFGVARTPDSDIGVAFGAFGILDLQSNLDSHVPGLQEEDKERDGEQGYDSRPEDGSQSDEQGGVSGNEDDQLSKSSEANQASLKNQLFNFSSNQSEAGSQSDEQGGVGGNEELQEVPQSDGQEGDARQQEIPFLQDNLSQKNYDSNTEANFGSVIEVSSLPLATVTDDLENKLIGSSPDNREGRLNQGFGADNNQPNPITGVTGAQQLQQQHQIAQG